MSRMNFTVVECDCEDPECEKFYIQTDDGERLGLVNTSEGSAAAMICRERGRADMLAAFMNQIATPRDELN